jgi:hypothetical protein
MGLDDPVMLFSSLTLGLVGMALFLYGKRSGSGRSIGAGLLLGLVPLLAHTALALWALSGACLAGWWLLGRAGWS